MALFHKTIIYPYIYRHVSRINIFDYYLFTKINDTYTKTLQSVTSGEILPDKRSRSRDLKGLDQNERVINRKLYISNNCMLMTSHYSSIVVDAFDAKSLFY